MAAISNVGIKLAGSHAGVSIGEDGPSQMALEDLAMCRAQPNYRRALSVRRGQRRAAAARWRPIIPGPAYMRTSRPKTPVIYANDETFTIGGLKVLRQSRRRRGHGRRRRRHGVRGAEGLRPAEGDGHADPRHRPVFGAAGRRRGADRRRQGDRRADHHGRGSLRRRRHRRRGRARRWPRRASASTGSPSEKFPAAASPTSCSTASASPPATSSRR